MIKIKRILSCVLVLLLIVASIPATSIAAINDESEPTVTAEVVQTNFTPESEEAEGRSVSDDKDNPIASVSANYVTAQTGIVVNSNGQITRAEWLHNLAVIFEMTIESNAIPDNYFSDLEESHEYYEDILLAVEFGVVSIEAGEPIYPDEPVTREFAASTLNFCLGYQLDSEMEYTFTDYAECTDPDSAQVAVDRGWFTLVSGKFSPNLYITESEAEHMLNDTTAILEQTIVDDNYDSEFVFADDVIVVPDGTDVKEDGNGQISISDCPVTINKNDKFAVYFNGIPSVYTADSVTTNKTVTKITATVVDSDESFINVDAQGVAGADVMEIEPVEGVDVSFEDETTGASTYAIRKIKTIKAKTEIELFTGVTADVSVKIKSPQVEYSINSNYAYVALEGDTEISYNIEANVAEMYLGDKAVELFTCSVLGVGDFTVSVEFKVSGSASGSVKGYLVAGLECTNGGKLRAIKSFQQKQYSTNIEATASVGLKVKLGITKMPVINAYVYAEAGVKANLKTTIYNNSGSNKCVNFKAYLYAKYGAQASAKFGGWKTSLSVEYDIFNESNSPVKIVHHYENGMLVPFCTKGSEYSNYFTNDSSRWSGSGWTSANGAYGLSADGTPVARYTYTLDDKNNATITNYNGNSWSIYIPEKIDGYTVVGIGGNAFSNEEMVSVVIPDTVTKIEGNAFSQCAFLREVTLSDSLTYLGWQAFGNTAIEEIRIPKSLEKCEAFGPFYECKQLKKVTFESGITQIPESMFENCTGLESIVIPDTVTVIESRAFANCTGLESIVIPDTVTVIESSAFNNAEALKSVTLSKNLTSIESDAFRSCSSLESIVIPDTVTKIGWSVFYNCTSLKDVKLSKSLTYLGSMAFGSTAIDEIEIPKSLDSCELSGPFYECKQLKKVTFESGITQIPESMFENCTGLESIVIPDTVTVIESRAFANCTGLESILIPDTVTVIESSAFNNAEALKNVTLSKNLTSIESDAFRFCSSLERIVIPDTVTKIGWSAFYNCTSLKDVKLSKSLTYLGSMAFGSTAIDEIEIPKTLDNCDGSGPFYGCEQLKKVTFESGTTQIPVSVFANCSGIESILIPDTVTVIESSAFNNAEALKSVTLSSNLTSIGSSAFLCCSSLESIVIPDTVTKIEGSAFSQCTSLKEIVIPDSVTSLGWNCFEGCTSLENIKLSNKIESIPLSLLKNCTLLNSVEFPETVKSIELYAFYGCTSLKEAILPETVTTIGSYAFQNCSSLTKVSIPRTTKTIGNQAFMGCEKFSELNISDYSITEIKSQTFKDCPGLVNVVLPKGLKTIGSEAFVNCTSLAEVYIPESVTSIDKSAFSYPDKMTIAGRTGSYAETFAEENGFKFVDKSISAEGIALLNEVEEVVVDRGETFNAVFECFPDNATDVITLMSDNSNVKIDGLDIIGRYKGVSVITATATSGVTYEFTVRVRDVKSIDVVTLPKKLTYNIGEELDLSGMVVEVTRDDGSVEEITDYEVIGFDNSVEGECKVTVKWVALSGSSYTSTFMVEVIDTCPKINGIYIAKTPTKLNYAPKESLDLTGMVVIATYTDGSEQEIADYKVSGYNALKKGSQTITVTYGEFMVTFSVYVGTSGENLNPSEPDTTDPTESTTDDNTIPSEPAVDKGILGDVNGDGKVNIKDATQIQKYAAKLVELTDAEKLRADVNADGKNNVKDATAIQKFVAKIETSFPIGDKIA